MKKYCLEEVADIFSGTTPLTKEKGYYEGGTISWITPKDLSGYNHKYIYQGKRSITNEGFQSCAARMLPKGAVLFSSRAPIGYVALAGKEMCTNQGFKSFVCKNELLYNHYLYYYLLYNRKKLEALGNGSTFKEISRKTICKYEIELPSFKEQKIIVSELVNLDEKYEHNCMILQEVDQLLEYMYCKFFENNAICYTLKPLSDVAEIVTGGTPSTKNDNYWNNGIYDWFTPSDVTACENIISYAARKKINVSGLANSGAKLVPAYSVMMTSRATVGQCVLNMQEATTNQGMLSLIPDKKQICVLQLYYWIKRNKSLIASIANGSTFKEVYKKDLEKLCINIDENSKNSFMNQTNDLIRYYSSIVKENMLIEELKIKIMQSIFNKRDIS